MSGNPFELHPTGQWLEIFLTYEDGEEFVNYAHRHDRDQSGGALNPVEAHRLEGLRDMSISALVAARTGGTREAS